MEAANPKVFASEYTKFWQDSQQNLYMGTENGVLGPVRVKRAFPLTAPQDVVAIEDSEGRFLGIIMHYGQMDSDSIQVLEARLEQEYFLPEILKIYEIKDQLSLLTWRVETNRGFREFEVRNRRADIRWFSDTHVVIQDADGNKYEIPDLSRLDAASRQKVEMEV